ncbi:ras-related protein Rab-7L1-like isoform X1 [Biomphalaria glabrata]|uniref:Ras-related protein Rab-7L1-like isoform X1 n=2 Tax=Biomphalaria glabrata TaxID=6526 RepID=A0A9W3A2R4_BIOGL|nr:ras-related protein Rab-7L1-like isoform X1 [Biomphalaria glabrata]
MASLTGIYGHGVSCVHSGTISSPVGFKSTCCSINAGILISHYDRRSSMLVVSDQSLSKKVYRNKETSPEPEIRDKRRMYKRLNVCVDQLQDDVIKILVIGDAGVGKTSFVQKYVYDVFSDKYKCTIGFDSVTKKVTELNQKPVNLQLQFWDIAGQDRFPLLTRAYYKYTRGCLIIFDLTNPESFNDVRKWKASLDNNLSVPCLLVANKVDLESERKVSPSDIERLVTELNFFQFTETSVKTGLMVEESVMYLVDVVLGNSPSTYTPSDFEHVDLREIRDLDTSQTRNGKKKCAICS